MHLVKEMYGTLCRDVREFDSSKKYYNAVTNYLSLIAIGNTIVRVISEAWLRQPFHILGYSFSFLFLVLLWTFSEIECLFSCLLSSSNRFEKNSNRPATLVKEFFACVCVDESSRIISVYIVCVNVSAQCHRRLPITRSGEENIILGTIEWIECIGSDILC